MGSKVETEVLCQVHEWVLELRVFAGLPMRPMKPVLLSDGAILAVASGTGDPMQWGRQGPPEYLLR